ncbi:MAG: serine protease [Tepidisphaeraceae bacterium]
MSAILLGLSISAAGDPATQPADHAKTGELDLVFSHRSQLSDRKELARRLNLKESEMGQDYDLSQCPFKAYVPTNYDPSTPCGVFVYLNYKNTDSVPPLWLPVLDQSHLIFISPVCNSIGVESTPVPLWQTMGLALDAVDNLKQQYAIDDKRIYLMTFNNGTPVALSSADVFTGFVLAYDQLWFRSIPAGNGRYYAASCAAPPAALRRQAKERPFFLIGPENDELCCQQIALKKGAMKADGFGQLMEVDLSNDNDLHYPNFSLPWFSQKALPFLDAARDERLNQAIDSAKTAPATRPTPPAWMAKPPDQWPQILLRNRIVDKNNGVGYSGSSSLMRLPGGVVVLGTAGHLLGDAKPADFNSIFKSWTAFAVDPSRGGVLMTRVAMDVANPPSMDVLVLCPRSQQEQWPGTVLPIRQEPLEIGDTVYLLAVPYDGKTRQNVYKGVVVDYSVNHELQYNVEGSFNHMGCSGAPVIDEYGQLAAINVGHLHDQTIPGKMQLVCIDTAEVLQVIKLPPDVKPARAESDAARPSPTVSSGDVADLINQKAAAALRGAQLLIDNKMYAAAKIKLQNIIDSYPASDAAKKAGELLSQLPEQ